MNVVSTLGSLHNEVSGYSYGDFIDYVSQFSFKNIIIVYTDKKNYIENKEKFVEIEKLEKKFNIEFPEIDFEHYKELSQKYWFKSKTPEEITKKNINDIIDTVTGSYLRGYWKDAVTVNSEITDSLYKMKIQFMASINPDYVSEYWTPLREKIFNFIDKKYSGDLIVARVDEAFYYREKFKN